MAYLEKDLSCLEGFSGSPEGNVAGFVLISEENRLNDVLPKGVKGHNDETENKKTEVTFP